MFPSVQKVLLVQKAAGIKENPPDLVMTKLDRELAERREANPYLRELEIEVVRMSKESLGRMTDWNGDAEEGDEGVINGLKCPICSWRLCMRSL